MEGAGSERKLQTSLVLATAEHLFEISDGLPIKLACPPALAGLLADHDSCIVSDEAFVSTPGAVLVFNLDTGRQLRQVPVAWDWAVLTVCNGRVFTFHGNRVYQLVESCLVELCSTEEDISCLAVRQLSSEGDCLEFFYQGKSFQLFAVRCVRKPDSDKLVVTETMLLDELITLIGADADSAFVQTPQLAFVEIRAGSPFWGLPIEEEVDDWLSCDPVVYARVADNLHIIDTANQYVSTILQVPHGNLLVKQNFA